MNYFPKKSPILLLYFYFTFYYTFFFKNGLLFESIGSELVENYRITELVITRRIIVIRILKPGSVKIFTK